MKNRIHGPGRTDLVGLTGNLNQEATDTDEVVNYCRERREKLLKSIKSLPDDFFESPTPDEGMFADAPNKAQMLLFISYHEGIHTGQFTVAHRGLGNEPMFRPNPEVVASFPLQPIQKRTRAAGGTGPFDCHVQNWSIAFAHR